MYDIQMASHKWVVETLSDKSPVRQNEKAKPQTTYRIYPQKIPALQKLLDRAYKSKATVGTQCEDIN